MFIQSIVDVFVHQALLAWEIKFQIPGFRAYVTVRRVKANRQVMLGGGNTLKNITG